MDYFAEPIIGPGQAGRTCWLAIIELRGIEMSSSKKFDIVVYGATGFTGQLVAEYLASHYKNDKGLKWAMAGRSLDKLKSVRDAIGAPADMPLVVADANDA